MEISPARSETQPSYEQLVATVEWLKEQVGDLRAEVAKLRGPSPASTRDGQWEEWRRAHWEELLTHRGEFVAIHPTQGIVASGSALGPVAARVQSLGLTKEARIELVRAR